MDKTLTMLIDNLYVEISEDIDYFYVRNGHYVDALILRKEFPIKEAFPSYVFKIEPFQFNPDHSEIIALTLRSEVPGIMLYQEDKDGDLVELTPRPLGNYSGGYVSYINVPLANVRSHNRRYAGYDMEDPSQEAIDKIESILRKLPDSVTDDDFDYILNGEPPVINNIAPRPKPLSQNFTFPPSVKEGEEPKYLLQDGWIMQFIGSLEDIRERIQVGIMFDWTTTHKDQYYWEINPTAQYLTGTQNQIISFFDKRGNTYLAKAHYNSETGEILPPI